MTNNKKPTGKDTTTFSGKPFSEVDFLVNADGKHLFCKYWKHDNPKYLICFVHGLGGHCARFEELALHLNSLEAYGYAHDHLGHGESEGERTTVSNYEFLTRDIIQHAEKMKKEYPDLPMFILGHSMVIYQIFVCDDWLLPRDEYLINYSKEYQRIIRTKCFDHDLPSKGGALALIAAYRNPKLFAGVVVSAGMLKIDPQLASPFKKFLVSAVSTILPGMRLSTLDDNNSSRDPKEMEIVMKDPLKSTVVKSEMVNEIIRIHAAIDSLAADFSLPFLALHGGADTTCDPQGSKWFYETAKSEDKTLKIYDECYHDVLHELPAEKKQCIEDIVQWLHKRLPQSVD